ncbi:hypothetical protein [Planktomarina sp.]|uniref:hypothetical protein n=1 Tax=Planktomarina sp. TaxID=2024851 RepID=UPI00326112B3
MAVSCSIVAHYGGGSLTFATEPSGSGSVNSFYWDASFLNIQDDSALNASGQVYWEVTRQSGTIGSTGEFSNTNGTSNITVTTNSGGIIHGFAPMQVFFIDDTVDETTGLGENFTISVYLNSSKTTLYASQAFKLYDADFNISGPAGTSVFTISSTATSHNVTFTQGGATETNARQIAIRDSSNNAVLFYDTWGATEYNSHTITIPNAHLPSAGNTAGYYIQVYNGQSYYTVGNSFTINRQASSLVAPVSSGAIVADETPTGNVSVSFNLSNTGSGGTFWAAQTTSASPTPSINDSVWNQYSVTDNSTASIPFSQPRETVRYYWARRFDGASTQAVGTPAPVTEQVPVNPSISSVSIGTNTHTVNITAYSPVNDPVSGQPITSIYYYQSTNSNAMASQSAWVDSGSDTPPSGWQTSSTFSATTGVTYYYWILAWTDSNPGPDGASLSTPQSQTTTAGGGVVGQSAGGYGFEVYNSSGQLRVGNLDKTSLFLGSHSVTLNSSGNLIGHQVPGATASDCYAIDLSGGGLFTPSINFTFGTDTLNITNGGANASLSFFVVRT